MIDSSSLEAFIANIPVESLACDLAPRCNQPSAQIRQLLATYINEMRAAMSLVAGVLDPKQRILEVGAGICLFSLYLKQAGYDITALEPATNGFDIFAILKQAVLTHYQAIALPVSENTAETISPERHGKFQLIFSHNVIEHIPNYQSAFQALSRCLTADGVMVHGCPNYFIPYEPHLQLPVLRCCPQLTKLMFPETVAKHAELWQSLNFIDYFTIKQLAKNCSLQVHFRPGLLSQTLERLDTDPEFRSRQTSMIISVAHKFNKLPGLHWLLKNLPPALATPMVFEMRHSISHD